MATKTKTKRILFHEWSEKSHNKRWLKVAPKKRRGKVFRDNKLVKMQNPKTRRKNPKSRKNVITPKKKFDRSIFALLDNFPDEKSCRDMFEQIRLGLNIGCPYCGSDKYTVFTLKKNNSRRYNCCNCRKHYALTQGTVLENTKLPFRKWFMGMYLWLNSSKGISSIEMARMLGITQKTAWMMLQRIRKMCDSYVSNLTFNGVVEVDETYMGTRPWKPYGKRPTGGATDKIAVFGIVQRDGDILAVPVKNTKKVTLQKIINQKVPDHNTTIMSDEHRSYYGLNKKYKHETVNHRRKEYAKPGGIHTNHIEAFWSFVKRGIRGVYHKVTPKHLDLYCAEFAYLSSKRNAVSEDRVGDLLKLCIGVFSYKDMVGKKPAWVKRR